MDNSRYNSTFQGKLYHGKSCSTDNLCHKFKPCQNDGTCIPSAGGYECQCPLGWKGKNCTDHVNPCDGESNHYFQEIKLFQMDQHHVKTEVNASWRMVEWISLVIVRTTTLGNIANFSTSVLLMFSSTNSHIGTD